MTKILLGRILGGVAIDDRRRDGLGRIFDDVLLDERGSSGLGGDQVVGGGGGGGGGLDLVFCLGGGIGIGIGEDMTKILRRLGQSGHEDQESEDDDPEGRPARAAAG